MSLIALRASGLSGGGSGFFSRPSLWNFFVLHCLPGLMLCLVPLPGSAAETNAPVSPPGQIQEPNSPDLLRALAQMQDQLQAMRLAMEQDRQDARAAAAQNAGMLSNGLQILDQAISAQGARELDSLQNSSRALEHSNRAMLTTAAAVAGIGFLALLLLGWFQWRASARLAEIVTAWPIPRGLVPPYDLPSLGPGDLPPMPGESADHANSRLWAALDQLDKRIRQMKLSLASGGNGDRLTSPAPASPAVPAPPGTDTIRALLQNADSLAGSPNPESALASFDELLSLAPNHAEALVRKGALLERLHKLNEAVECYDRAIAADSSLTLAYLHKGGLCSRLERFKEALECYEKALCSHEQRSNGR